MRISAATGSTSIAATFLAAMLALCCTRPSSARQLPAQFTIEIAVTPGKPGAPTEEVTLQWGGAACTVHVRRETARQHARAETGACRAAWRIAARLRDFQPREIDDPRAADFGSRSLALTWIEESSHAPLQRRMIWHRELANESDVKPLFEQLGSAARERVPGVRLHYIK